MMIAEMENLEQCCRLRWRESGRGRAAGVDIDWMGSKQKHRSRGCLEMKA